MNHPDQPTDDDRAREASADAAERITDELNSAEQTLWDHVADKLDVRVTEDELRERHNRRSPEHNTMSIDEIRKNIERHHYFSDTERVVRFLLDTIAQRDKEIAELKDCTDIVEMKQERDTARAALTKFGRHKTHCSRVLGDLEIAVLSCTCGFTAALDKSGASKAQTRQGGFEPMKTSFMCPHCKNEVRMEFKMLNHESTVGVTYDPYDPVQKQGFDAVYRRNPFPENSNEFYRWNRGCRNAMLR